MLQQLSRISVVITAMLLSMSIDAGQIHYAAGKGNIEEVKRLLNDGIDPNERDDDNNTPSHPAALRGHVGVVRLLLDSGAHVNAENAMNDTLLHRAVFRRHESVVQVLLRNGAYLNIQDNNGNIPAALARDLGHQGVLRAMRNYFIRGKNAPEGSRRMRLNMLQKQRTGQLKTACIKQ